MQYRRPTLCAIALLLFAPLALAQPLWADTRSPFEIDLAIDLPITLGAGGLGLAAELIKKDLKAPDRTYDRMSVNRFDRPVTYYFSAGSQIASDVLVYTTLALPVVLDLIDVAVSKPGAGYRGFGKAVMVMAETVMVALLPNQMVKFAVRRPRPYLFNPKVSAETKAGIDGQFSFFSQHTALAFAIATAYGYIFTKRHPTSPWRYVVWAGTMSLATSTSLLRVFAGRHYWSDVITGAAVGACIGFLVPYLHTLSRKPAGKSGETRFSLQPTIGRGLTQVQLLVQY
ncbi:MAG: phosphatase PAP2 family protein [Myxococcales bacterium]|nr:phosphatase PAP2 family protein [Myxococcales bacterium]